MATESMITASTPMNAAPANSPMPNPPALTLIFSSDFASAISCRTRVDMSRLASANSRPRVGSSLLGTSECGRVTGALLAWVMVPPSCPERTGTKPAIRARSGSRTCGFLEAAGAAAAPEHQGGQQPGHHRPDQDGGLRGLGLGRPVGQV